MFGGTSIRATGPAAAIAGLLVLAWAAPAAAAGATVVRTELSAGATVPCALGGAGEEVVVSGTIHTVLHQSTDASGGTHFLLRANYSGFSGTGQTSGTVYRAVATEGTSSHNFDPFVAAPYTVTHTQHVRFIGRGPGNDFTVRTVQHVTVNAQDEVTAVVDNLTVDCG